MLLTSKTIEGKVVMHGHSLVRIQLRIFLRGAVVDTIVEPTQRGTFEMSLVSPELRRKPAKRRGSLEAICKYFGLPTAVVDNYHMLLQKKPLPEGYGIEYEFLVSMPKAS